MAVRKGLRSSSCTLPCLGCSLLGSYLAPRSSSARPRSGTRAESMGRTCRMPASSTCICRSLESRHTHRVSRESKGGAGGGWGTLDAHALACPLHQPSHFAIGCGSHSAQPVQAPELQAHFALWQHAHATRDTGKAEERRREDEKSHSHPWGVIALAPPVAAVRRNRCLGQHAGNHDDHELRDRHLRGVQHLLA